MRNMTAATHSSPPPIARVIDKGFCIGCGACTALDSGFVMSKTPNGFLRITKRPRERARLEAASAVCPFATAKSEDELAVSLFPQADGYEEGIGRYISLYAGWSHELRSAAGSGGVTRWLLTRLLDSGAVDFVVAVNKKLLGAENGEDLFSYAIHESSDTLLQSVSASAYYPITLTEVLQQVRQRPGRFAVTALPCFARAIRNLAEIDPSFGDRLAFVFGTICGGLKSRRYAEYLSHQMGIEQERMSRINFRGKSLSRRANEKCVEVWREGNDTPEPDAVARVQSLRGTDYGFGYFKPKGCDFCDDVFAETADISLGDAWIPPYNERPQGTNVVVVRNPELEALLAKGASEGELVLEPLTPAQTRKTQESGLRHRRQGLATRLWIARAIGRWAPAKRVAPNRGQVAFVITQCIRVLVRKISSSSFIKPSGRALPLVMPPLAFLHGRLRRFSAQNQPDPPRARPTAQHLLELRMGE